MGCLAVSLIFVVHLRSYWEDKKGHLQYEINSASLIHPSLFLHKDKLRGTTASSIEITRFKNLKLLKTYSHFMVSGSFTLILFTLRNLLCAEHKYLKLLLWADKESNLHLWPIPTSLPRSKLQFLYAYLYCTQALL